MMTHHSPTEKYPDFSPTGNGIPLPWWLSTNRRESHPAIALGPICLGQKDVFWSSKVTWVARDPSTEGRED